MNPAISIFINQLTNFNDSVTHQTNSRSKQSLIVGRSITERVYIDCFAQKEGGYIALVLRGYEDVFGAEKQQKIIEIYDKHCGKD